MKRLLIAALLFLPLATQAQERTFTVTVTNAELGVIANALSERPYKEVNGVITNIARQVQTQNAAAEKPKSEQAPPAKKEGSEP